MPTIMLRTRHTTPPHATDPRWLCVAERDRSADGSFIYAVRSTGVFCRPSCGARLPKPENVVFFPNPQAAAAAGFRACKRCRPEAGPARSHADHIEAACRAIETAETAPSLACLAEAAGLSPFHFHRLFKTSTGVTPRAYAAAHRTRRVQAGLAQGRTVTQALYEAGFNASSRFYEQADAILGMAPSAYRAGGAAVGVCFAIGQCSLGAILVAATPRGVCAILLGDDPDALLKDLQDRFPRATLRGGDSGFEALVRDAIALVEAPSRGFDLPLDIRGTAFQHRVWQALRQIPPGGTLSYTALAARIGAPGAARAVAKACAANPLAVAIPCHRVVRLDGDVAGYRWGVERKRALLAREAP